VVLKSFNLSDGRFIIPLFYKSNFKAKECGLKTSGKGITLIELKKRIHLHLNGKILPKYYYNSIQHGN
jgi:hypothetical protein